MEEKRGVYRVSISEPECRRPLEKPRCRWEDNIKMGLREVRWEIGSMWLRIGINGGFL
jgi:hypothetical protein